MKMKIKKIKKMEKKNKLNIRTKDKTNIPKNPDFLVLHEMVVFAAPVPHDRGEFNVKIVLLVLDNVSRLGAIIVGF